MTEQIVLNKTTSTSHNVTVAIREVLRGKYSAVVYLDGKHFNTGNVMKLDRPQGNVTHFVQSGKTGIGFTAAEAQVIAEAIAQAEAEYAMSPAGQMAALRQERQDLVADIQGAEAQARADFDRLHARQDERCWQVKAEGETKVRAALAVLTRWDEAHPTVIAQIRAEKAEELKRFEESN